MTGEMMFGCPPTPEEWDEILPSDGLDDLDRMMMDMDNEPRWKKYLRNKSFGGYNLLYWMHNPHRFPGEVYRKARTFTQRGRRGWANSDTWSLDDYLIGWLPDAVHHLAKYSYGHPAHLTSDEWDAILVKIESGLRAGARYSNYEWGTVEEREELHSQFLEAWDLMRDNYWSLWN